MKFGMKGLLLCGKRSWIWSPQKKTNIFFADLWQFFSNNGRYFVPKYNLHLMILTRGSFDDPMRMNSMVLNGFEPLEGNVLFQGQKFNNLVKISCFFVFSCSFSIIASASARSGTSLSTVYVGQSLSDLPGLHLWHVTSSWRLLVRAYMEPNSRCCYGKECIGFSGH